MRLTRILVGAIAALALVPASAFGQAPADLGDHYLAPIFLPNSSEPLPVSPSVLGYEIPDTNGYTTDDGQPVFGGGPEFNQCQIGGRTSNYGKTVWSAFRADRYGRLDVTATGFDAVIGLVTFKDPSDATPTPLDCSDRLGGKIESFPRDNLPTVQKGGWYALQVGGFLDPATGQFAGGGLQVNVELLKPEQIVADAGITWVARKGGVTIKQIRVLGPDGAVAAIQCAKKSCGRQTVRNPKRVGVFKEPVLKAKTNLTQSTSTLKPKAGKKPAPQMLAKNVFKNKKVKNGAQLVVVVLGSNNQIGQGFLWNIKNNAAGAKQIVCVEPDGESVAAIGKCDGK